MNNKYNLTIPQKSILLMEQYYSNNYSLLLDVKIILKTVKVVLKMNGAE